MNAINFGAVKTVMFKGYMKLRKISPELALAGGVACGVGAVVVGVMRAKKIREAIDDAHKDLDDIQAKRNELDEKENPTKEEVKEVKQMTWRAYNKMVWRVARALAPVVGLEAASIALILLSHGILNNRYLNTTAALGALNEAFTGYRGRVKDLIGEDAEKVLMAGGKVEKDIQIEDENGEIVTKNGQSLVFGNGKNSPYEFDFNRHTAPLTWNPNPDYSEMFLRNSQNYFNDLLQARGHVFLNEVLDHLGLKRTPAGQVCGWIKGAGDDYIDFGYMDGFIRDYRTDSDLCKQNIHLNFNVDGSIWDMI